MDAKTLADRLDALGDDGSEGNPWSQEELDLIIRALRGYVDCQSRDAARYEWLRTFLNFSVTNERLKDEGFPTLDHAVDYGMLAHDEHAISPGSE